MKKILAAALIMLTLLCGCEKEAPSPTAAALTLPHEIEFTDNEQGSNAAEEENFSFEQVSSFESSEPALERMENPKGVVEKSKEEQNFEPSPAPTSEPEFDIDYWVSFAKGYAASVGLELNSDATDCWDDPISADSRCVYLERDICNRLDRYSASEEITAVWIWSEALGNGSYSIYIGYA